MLSVLTRELVQRAPAPAGGCTETCHEGVGTVVRELSACALDGYSTFACDVQVYLLGGLLHDVRGLTYHSRQMHSGLGWAHFAAALHVALVDE